MKNWVKIICGLIILGIVLYFVGAYSHAPFFGWLAAIVAIIVGVAGLIYLDVNWGKFLDHTL